MLLATFLKLLKVVFSVLLVVSIGTGIIVLYFLRNYGIG